MTSPFSIVCSICKIELYKGPGIIKLGSHVFSVSRTFKLWSAANSKNVKAYKMHKDCQSNVPGIMKLGSKKK